MSLASSRHRLSFWFGRPPRMSLSEAHRSQGPRESRSLVPWHEKLLLMGVLLIVVAWISFHVVMLLAGSG